MRIFGLKFGIFRRQFPVNKNFRQLFDSQKWREIFRCHDETDPVLAPRQKFLKAKMYYSLHFLTQVVFKQII